MANDTEKLREALLDFICDDVLPAYDIDSSVPRNDPELAEGLRAVLGTTETMAERIEEVCHEEGLNGAACGWRACTGCHESNEGVPQGAYSPIFKTHVGRGCSECGGIGVVWEYWSKDGLDDMARDLSTLPQPEAAGGGVREAKTRDQFYYPIVMPLNEDGHGPADIKDAVTLTWEVWDQEFMSHGSFEFLLDAIDKANELNAALSTPQDTPRVPEDGGEAWQVVTDAAGDTFIRPPRGWLAKELALTTTHSEEVAQLRAEVERLTRERDYAWSSMKTAQAYWRAETNHAEQAEARAEAAEAELAALKAGDVTDGWLRDTAMDVMLATEVDEAVRILAAALKHGGGHE